MGGRRENGRQLLVARAGGGSEMKIFGFVVIHDDEYIFLL